MATNPTLTQQVAALVASNVALSALAQQIIARGQGSDGRSLTNRGAWQAQTYAPGDYVFAVGSNSTTNSLWFLLDSSNYASTKLPSLDLSHWQELAAPGGVGGSVWGNVTGNLSQQADLAALFTDLATALGLRLRFDAAQTLSTAQITRAHGNLALTGRLLPAGGSDGQVLSLSAGVPTWVAAPTSSAPAPSPSPSPSPSPAPAPAPEEDYTAGASAMDESTAYMTSETATLE